MERQFSAFKNIMTDKRTSLNEDKLHKLLFLKNKSAYLKRNKKELIKHHAHSKRRVSATDDESALSINQSENLTSLSTSKKVKRRNEDDNDSDENDPNEILAQNDKRRYGK